MRDNTAEHVSTPVPENTRRRASAKNHRERAAMVTARIEEAPTQVAINASITLQNDESTPPKKRKSNGGNYPWSCGSLHRQRHLVYERCDLSS